MKKLRRKNAAFNLNQYQAHMSQPHQPPFAASSVASSPPPLSPSHSPSAWSEQGPESLDGFCRTSHTVAYYHVMVTDKDSPRVAQSARRVRRADLLRPSVAVETRRT
jgi:hypothetical protein